MENDDEIRKRLDKWWNELPEDFGFDEVAKEMGSMRLPRKLPRKVD